MRAPSGRPSTIIVDPGLIAEAERLSESQRPRPISSDHELPETEPSHNGGNGSDVAAAHGSESIDGESTDAESTDAESTDAESTDAESTDALDLSIEEAEYFANAFRASWEPSAPTPSAAPAPVNVPIDRLPKVASHIAEPVAPRVLISDLPGTNRRRTMMLASGALAGFLAILVLGWLASRSGAPDHPSSDNPLANSASEAPAEPKIEAAPAPAPEPVKAPEAPAAPVAAPEAPVEPAPEAIVAAPAEPVAAPSAPIAPAEAAPPPAQADQVLVALQITTQPSNAQLTLDGTPISNPYEAMHPQGGSHVVEASAPGYQARNLKVELTKKRSVALELQREPAAAPAPRATKPKRARPPRAKAPAKKNATFIEESPY